MVCAVPLNRGGALGCCEMILQIIKSSESVDSFQGSHQIAN